MRERATLTVRECLPSLPESGRWVTRSLGPSLMQPRTAAAAPSEEVALQVLKVRAGPRPTLMDAPSRVARLSTTERSSSAALATRSFGPRSGTPSRRHSAAGMVRCLGSNRIDAQHVTTVPEARRLHTGRSPACLAVVAALPCERKCSVGSFLCYLDMLQCDAVVRASDRIAPPCTPR